MIIAFLRLSVSPKNREEVLKIVRLILEPTLVEDGCINFRFYRELENEDEMLLIQEWKSHADLDRYIRAEHYRKILAIMDLAKEKPDIKFHKISRTSGMETIIKALEAKAHVKTAFNYLEVKS